MGTSIGTSAIINGTSIPYSYLRCQGYVSSGVKSGGTARASNLLVMGLARTRLRGAQRRAGGSFRFGRWRDVLPVGHTVASIHPPWRLCAVVRREVGGELAGNECCRHSDRVFLRRKLSSPIPLDLPTRP